MQPRASVALHARSSAAGLALAIGLLVAALPAKAQDLVFTPFHQNGIYNLGEKAGWTVTLPTGAAAPGALYNYLIKKNNSDTFATWRCRGEGA